MTSAPASSAASVYSRPAAGVSSTVRRDTEPSRSPATSDPVSMPRCSTPASKAARSSSPPANPRETNIATVPVSELAAAA